MSWDKLDRLECPFNWEDVCYMDFGDREQVLDQLPIYPKNWKRVVDLMRVAYFEAEDYEFDEAKTHLKDAYTCILEPFGELYLCGACILYREAIKHVLDSTWAHIVQTKLSEDDDKWQESPEAHDLCKFIEEITPADSLGYQQQAALYAIRAHFCVDPENLSWIQKAIHLSPAEAQWYIDLQYMRWSEDPIEPLYPYLEEGDSNMVLKCINLVSTNTSPSHSARGAIREALGEPIKWMRKEKSSQQKKKKPSQQRNKPELKQDDGMFPGEVWVVDLELLRLMGRTVFLAFRGDPTFWRINCLRPRQHRKKCTCMPAWLQHMIEWMLIGQVVAGSFSPIKPANSKLPIYPMLQAGLVQQDAGDVDSARVALQKVCAVAPDCQHAHMRLAVALSKRPNRLHEKAAAELALEHAKKCEDLYPDATEYVQDCIEEARRLASAPPKPTQCVRKAGRRR